MLIKKKWIRNRSRWLLRIFVHVRGNIRRRSLIFDFCFDEFLESFVVLLKKRKFLYSRDCTDFLSIFFAENHLWFFSVTKSENGNKPLAKVSSVWKSANGEMEHTWKAQLWFLNLFYSNSCCYVSLHLYISIDG